jgi:hypothetical protein
MDWSNISSDSGLYVSCCRMLGVRVLVRLGRSVRVADARGALSRWERRTKPVTCWAYPPRKFAPRKSAPCRSTPRRSGPEGAPPRKSRSPRPRAARSSSAAQHLGSAPMRLTETKASRTPLMLTLCLGRPGVPRRRHKFDPGVAHVSAKSARSQDWSSVLAPPRPNGVAADGEPAERASTRAEGSPMFDAEATQLRHALRTADRPGARRGYPETCASASLPTRGGRTLRGDPAPTSPTRSASRPPRSPAGRNRCRLRRPPSAPSSLRPSRRERCRAASSSCCRAAFASRG